MASSGRGSSQAAASTGGNTLSSSVRSNSSSGSRVRSNSSAPPNNKSSSSSYLAQPGWLAGLRLIDWPDWEEVKCSVKILHHRSLRWQHCRFRYVIICHRPTQEQQLRAPFTASPTNAAATILAQWPLRQKIRTKAKTHHHHCSSITMHIVAIQHHHHLHHHYHFV